MKPIAASPAVSTSVRAHHERWAQPQTALHHVKFSCASAWQEQTSSLPFALLSSLPVDLLLVTSRHVLVAHLPSAVRLLQTHKAIREWLGPVHEEAKARRLQWLPETLVACQISQDGRTATKTTFGFFVACAASRLLPTSGKSAWIIRVDKGDQMMIGVCNAACRDGWGLIPAQGALHRTAVGDDGGSRQAVDASGRRLFHSDVPPPTGWPNGHFAQVMKDAAGKLLTSREASDLWRSDLQKHAGSVLEVAVDHDAGTLSYRVNGGQLLPALSGFPRGCSLRAWVSLNGGSIGDTVSIQRPYFIYS